MDENQFFLHSKFSYFTDKHYPDESRVNLTFSSLPILIRQSIELKIKSIIGLERVLKSDKNIKIIPISKIIRFLEKESFLDCPVSLKTLGYINFWTNTFIHTGIHPFSWQSLEAIDLIESLFTIKQWETGNLDLRGFTFLKKNITLEQIKEKLDTEFRTNFILNEKLMPQQYNI
jgi:hypothetical protein